MIVYEYFIELQTYHDEIVGRLQFINEKRELEESNLYSLSELENIIALWRDDYLQGSFAIGASLSEHAVQRFVQKVKALNVF